MAKKFRFKNRVAICLAGSVFLGTVGLPNIQVVAMEEQSKFTDTKGHWASEAIDRMSSYQLINGYNGLFRPSDPITRGEMSIIIDHIMGYQKEADNIFVDLEEAFYTDAVLKAYEADLLLETNGLVRPKDNITREEVAFMVYNAFDIEPSQEALSFLDADQVSSWAMESVTALASQGVIIGSEGKFAPQAPITRAEAVTILNRLLTGYYNEKGTYTGEINGKAVISTSDANLKDVVIKGDLIIAEGVAEGDVVLENVVVEGRTIIRGGGVNSIKVEGESKLGDVLMAKEGSAVRLAVSESSEVNHVTVGKQATDVVVEGQIDKVKVEAQGAKLTVQNADVQMIEVAAESAKVELRGKTDIKEVAINKDAANTEISVTKDAKVQTVNAEAKSTISGTGKVSTVNANANDIVVKTEGTEVKAAEGTTGVMAGDVPVKGGSNSSTSKPGSSGSSGSSDDSSSNDKPNKEDLAIAKIETVRNGLVRVTLNRASDKPLVKDQFSIICTTGGRDMTILGVSTTDNKIYDITTAYYDDNGYNLGITLDDGKLISKDFVSKYDCPEITEQEMTRTDANRAEFTFISDTAGTFYYALGKAEAARTMFNEEPTAEELMEKGTKVDMKYQYNEIQIDGLTENTPYTLYYVAVDHDNKVTPVKSIQIAAEPVQQPEEGEFTIINAKGFSLPATDFFDEMGGFEFELNKATTKPLKAEDFTIVCPRDGELTLGRVETTDNKTYKVYMQKGYMFVSGNTYNATITFDNGTQANKKFFVDVWADDVTDLNVKLTTDSALQVSFKAKENGKIYYDVTDEDQQNTKPKDPAELFEKGQVKEIKAGYNVLEDIVAQEGQWFRYAIEDELGNRMARYSYKQVPEYEPEDKPGEEEELKVTNIEFKKGGGSFYSGQIVLTFNKEFDVVDLKPKDITITNIDGIFMVTPQIYGRVPTDPIKLDLQSPTSIVINSGEHVLTFKLLYKGKDGVTKEKVFVETFTTN